MNYSDDDNAMLQWLNEYRHQQNTKVSYLQIAGRFMFWLQEIKQMHLGQVTRQELQEYQDFLSSPPKYLVGDRKPRQNKDSRTSESSAAVKITHWKPQNEDWKPFATNSMSASSVKTNFQVLMGMYEYLIEIDYLYKNPFKLKKIKTINKSESVEKYLTEDQINLVFEFIDHLPESSPKQKKEKERKVWLLTLLYRSALRRSEVAKAQMHDVIYLHDKWWLKVIGKGDKEATIPFTNNLIDGLKRYRISLGLSPLPRGKENIPLVASIDSKMKQITDKAIYNIVKSVFSDLVNYYCDKDEKLANLFSRVSTHWLRHTSATHQANSGLDIRLVKENLRHSNIETTLRYQHTEEVTRHEETEDKFK